MRISRGGVRFLNQLRDHDAACFTFFAQEPGVDLIPIEQGQEIAFTFAYPPHIYMEIFLVGLVVQALFSVTPITLSAVTVLYGLNAAYTYITGSHQFVDSNIPVLVFLGAHLLVTDPAAPTPVQGAYDPATNTGVIPLTACGPNGATVGLHDNLLLGCTPGNLPGSTTTQVINATTHNYAQVAGITGSDEVWFNEGDGRYYTGSNNAIKPTGSPLNRGSVLGVIDGTSVLIETIPQSSGSHSVAADSKHNLIFVPETYTSSPTAIPLGDQNFTAGVGSATVGQLICGTTNGCIAVYIHHVEEGHGGEGEEEGKRKREGNGKGKGKGKG